MGDIRSTVPEADQTDERNRTLVRMGNVSPSEFKDIYTGVNSWKSLFDHSTGVKDNAAWNLAGLGSDAISFGQTVAQQSAKALDNSKIAEAWETPVIEAGLLILMGMSNSLGIGEPESGDQFGAAADAYSRVSKTLSSTHSPESWDSASSEKYDQRNKSQKSRAEKMAQQDAVIKQALDEQRINVKNTRDFIDHRATALTAAIIPAVLAMDWQFPPGSGFALSMEIQWAAYAATVPFASERYGEMLGHAAIHAQDIMHAALEYDQVAREANQAVS